MMWKQLIQYPSEELEWLTTTTFNYAVDLYCSAQDVACRHWAEKALMLSAICDDGEALHEVLQQKYQGLTWHH